MHRKIWNRVGSADVWSTAGLSRRWALDSKRVEGRNLAGGGEGRRARAWPSDCAERSGSWHSYDAIQEMVRRWSYQLPSQLVVCPSSQQQTTFGYPCIGTLLSCLLADQVSHPDHHTHEALCQVFSKVFLYCWHYHATKKRGLFGLKLNQIVEN